jgi:hypothetical protein
MLSLLLALASPAADLRPMFHYRRTNGDGSEAEEIYVFAEAPGRIAVMRQKSRCTNAAYVTAAIDPASGQATALVGGRLTRELTQEPFAWLATAEGGTRLQARIGSRDAAPSHELAVTPSWRVYDFDFADMAAYPPKEIGTRTDFAFDLPLILSSDDGFTFSNRGRMTLSNATFRRAGAALSRERGGGQGDAVVRGAVGGAARGAAAAGQSQRISRFPAAADPHPLWRGELESEARRPLAGIF